MNISRHISNAKQSIIVRTITSQTGEKYLAHILVVETENGVDLRVLSVKPVNDVVELLPGGVSSQHVFSQNTFLGKVVSPFVSDFTFFLSQPTRAPACK
jgi:hypothetical protein